MPTIREISTIAFLSAFLLAPALPAQTADAVSAPSSAPEAVPQSVPSPAAADADSAGTSKIRIVRLSEVRGAVQMDRNIGRGFEPAIANMPITEHSKLSTGQGVAEVEFEDNSTLRLAPDSAVEFPRLERTASGATASTVRLLKGTAYISMVKSKAGNDFDLLFGQQKLALPPATHIRLQLQGNNARLAVLDGTLHVAGPSGIEDVGKKKTVTFALRDQAQEASVAKNVAELPFDEWDKTSAKYHARTASASALRGAPYSYGLNDMMYYGSFLDAGGCGMMWQPYFVSAAWDPYSNGAWSWYPGAGYTWVSPYPWGWTPYHYGSWNFCPGVGWGWQPGGSWYGLNNGAALMAVAPGGGAIGPRPIGHPIHPPGPGGPTTVAVSARPLVHSGVDAASSFVFRRDSAGLGIPRDGLGNLNRFSHEAFRHGSASAPVYMTAPQAGNPATRGNGMRSMRGNTAGPVAIHRGPPPSSGGGNMRQAGGGPSSGMSGGPRGGGGPSSSISRPSGPPPSAPSGGRPR